MYGLGGERRLTEFELPHLPGYEGSSPVRIGNAASEQFQLDVYGEVVGRRLRRHGAHGPAARARFAPRWRALIYQVEQMWREPDDGIWEARGAAAPLHPLEGHGLGRPRPGGALRRARGPGSPGRRAGPSQRDEIHAEVCEQGLGSGPAHLHPVLRLGGARRRGADDPDRRLPARRRRARDRHHRRRPRRASGTTASWRGTRPTETDDGLAGERGPVPGVLVLAGERAGAERAPRRGAGAVRAPAGAVATTSACWPRSTTSRAGARSAISPRPSAIWP